MDVYDFRCDIAAIQLPCKEDSTAKLHFEKRRNQISTVDRFPVRSTAHRRQLSDFYTNIYAAGINESRAFSFR